MISSEPHPRGKVRYLEIDVFRGIALLMVVFFNLIYDLNLYQVTAIDLYQNPFGRVYIASGVFLFLGVSGGCLFLDYGRQIRWGHFWNRILRISLAALVVTVSTYLFNPKYFVYLGILHFIVLASFLALPFLRFRTFNLFLAVALLAFGYIGDLNAPTHYVPYLAWLGFGSNAAPTFDIFPLIPYFGDVLLGIFLTSQALREGKDYLFIKLNPSRPSNQFLSFLGRHTLIIYLVQRPIDIGLLQLFTHR